MSRAVISHSNEVRAESKVQEVSLVPHVLCESWTRTARGVRSLLDGIARAVQEYV